MSIIDRVFETLNNRRNRILSGKVNAIPWGLPRFEEYNPGIEKAKYYIITASSKVGKTQITDFLFVYNAYKQIIINKLPIKLVIKYFSLEMSKEEKVTQFLSNLLFIKSGMKIIISPTNLRSTRKAVDEYILKYLENEREYIEGFLSCVEFIDNIRNPYGIFNHMRQYALDHGTQHKKTVDWGNGPIEVDDWYEENDPEEYVLPIVDHAKLLSPEKGSNIQQAIGELSSKYFIQLRNKYFQSPVLIQQQAAAQESVDNMKANRLRPTLDGLGENKTTQQDANVILGLFSPFRHHIPEYEGYNIKFFRDNIRFLEILGGREGGAGTICPLYFNGAVNYFRELPRSDDEAAMKAVEQVVINNRNNEYK